MKKLPILSIAAVFTALFLLTFTNPASARGMLGWHTWVGTASSYIDEVTGHTGNNSTAEFYYNPSEHCWAIFRTDFTYRTGKHYLPPPAKDGWQKIYIPSPARLREFLGMKRLYGGSAYLLMGDKILRDKNDTTTVTYIPNFNLDKKGNVVIQMTPVINGNGNGTVPGQAPAGQVQGNASVSGM